MSILRRAAGALVAAIALLGVLVVPEALDGPDTAVVEAADTRQFSAGNIITDQLFFDGGAMSAAEVQRFLDVRNPNCVPGPDGTPCLKHYRQTTTTRTADARCRGSYVGAADETAATIIAKVGQACGISQRVLLVILQKEQSLVTGSGSSLYADRYVKAMGYACPDTAACNPEYAGFYNQVYNAAARYKYYAANPTLFNHRAGTTNNVRFHPNSACGTSPVYIKNQATAGLYNYTPYQPNAAALAAGKGTGDACSAYGNRNFWIYFTDWFGSTQTAGAGDLVDRYVATGGESGPLGAVATAVSCGLRDGGCWQGFANGAIYWAPATGARIVYSGPVRDRWATLSWERGRMGYPTSDAVRTPDGTGWYGHFQGGSIYWSSATGARTLSAAIRDRWASLGWQTSPLGYPAADQGVTPDGQAQYVHFQNGSMYWSAATGARVVQGAVRSKWSAMGWERSFLGLPVSDVRPTPDGVAEFAHFQGGSIYSVSGVARALSVPVVAAWQRSGWEHGPLGYPAGDLGAAPGGRGEVMAFQNGAIYVDEAGKGHLLHGAVDDGYAAAGGDTGDLGLPVSDVGRTPDGRAEFAHFEGGSIYAMDTGDTWLLPSAVVAAWRRSGWERGPLGYPDSAVTPVGDGAVLAFERGSVYVSGTAAGRILHGPVGDAFVTAGGPSGPLGFPTTDVGTTPDGAGRYAHFRNGSIYWTQGTGARTVSGPIRDLWAGTGWERGLGYPTTSVTGTPDGRGQYAHFQGGSVYWTPETGARAVSGPVREQWAATGWERGLGYPTTSVSATPDGRGRYAHFEGGSIYWTAQTGARTLSGPVRAHWAAVGWERGLGYPTTSLSVTPDGLGRYAHFERGSVYWTQATGAHALSVAFRNAWASTGWERGSLGYPTRDAYAVSGGTRMDFQRGTITISSSTGRATVRVN